MMARQYQLFTTLTFFLLTSAFGRELLQVCQSLTERATEVGLNELVAAIDMVRDVSSAQGFFEAADATASLTDEFTIFTPDDDAWAELNADISALNEEAVFNIIGGHVVEGMISAQQLATFIADSPDGVLELNTVVEGKVLEFKSNNGEIYVSAKGTPEDEQPAVLVLANVPTCTGLVHTVSKVLVPEGVEVERIGELDDPDEGTGKLCVSAREFVEERNLTILQAALAMLNTFPSAQDILPALKADTLYNEQWTIFAPTDAAFLKAAGDVSSLTREQMDTLIASHVLVDQQDLAAIRNVAEDFSQGITTTDTVETLEGNMLQVGTADNQLLLQAVGSERPPAMVLEGNIKTCGGIIHIIDDVLTPEGFEDMTTGGGGTAGDAGGQPAGPPTTTAAGAAGGPTAPGAGAAGGGVQIDGGAGPVIDPDMLFPGLSGGYGGYGGGIESSYGEASVVVGGQPADMSISQRLAAAAPSFKFFQQDEVDLP